MEQNNNYNRVLSFANQNPACHFATAENDQPRVRGLLMWFADETGFYFHTSSVKSLSKQLKQNPKVEISFLKSTNNPDELEALRVNGVAEILTDTELEARLLHERPWLKDFAQISPESKAVIFRIRNGEAHFWDMKSNLQENKIERVKI